MAKQFEKFLRSLASDLELEGDRGEWLAVNFRNGSISWDAALQDDIPDAQVRHFNECLEFIADFHPDSEGTNALVSNRTLLEYARLGERIDADEVIGIGLYSGARSRLKWRRIEYRRASRIRRAIEEPILSHGSVHGLLHSVVLEAKRPYFMVHELSSDQAVRCYYEPTLYDDVIRALAHRSAIIHASGDMKLDRATRSIAEMDVERIDRVQPLSEDEFRSFFGISPNLTGDLSTADYVREYRDA